MPQRNFEPTLNLVTDRTLAGARALSEIVAEAIAGGVTLVQLREKQASTREFLEVATRLRRLTRQTATTLLINDRVDIALAVDADGVHVGQDDLPAELARELLGPERILGVTAGTVELVRAAQRAGADYVGCNAVFATPTKSDTGAPLGLDGLRRLVAGSPLPVIAIGGINADNVAEVAATGASGIAVVSAIVAAEDPRTAAKRLRERFEMARKERR
jgi:thiamine-phosphate pyrophosphorylase